MKLDLDAMERAARLHVEPIVWMVYSVDGQSARVTDNPAALGDDERALPLYTEPAYGDEAVLALCRIARAAGQWYRNDEGSPVSLMNALRDAGLLP